MNYFVMVEVSEEVDVGMQLELQFVRRRDGQAKLLQPRDNDCGTMARKEQRERENILIADEQQQVEDGKLVQQWTANGAQNHPRDLVELQSRLSDHKWMQGCLRETLPWGG